MKIPKKLKIGGHIKLDDLAEVFYCSNCGSKMLIPKTKMVKNRRVKEWAVIRAKLKNEFEAKGITRCEICSNNFGLSFAHRKKRVDYYNTDKLGDFNEVLLLCIPCHQRLEANKKLTEITFKRLRKC